MAINPLQQPINYSAQMVDLGPAFAGFGQAFQTLGQGFAAEAKREEAAAAKAEADRIKAQYATDLQAAIANPTQNSWNELIVKYPQQREAFESVRKNYSEERLKNEFKEGAEISMLLENGRPDLALPLVTVAIEARKNSGQPVGAFQRVKDALEANDTKTAQANVNGYMAFAFPDDFEKMVKAKTTAATAPSLVTKAVSEADKARIEANFAERLALAGLNKTNWDVKNLQSQINDRTQRFNLDKQVTSATVAEKMSSIQNNLNNIPADSRKLINEAATIAATSQQSAEQFKELANRLEAEGGGYGVASNAKDFFNRSFGRKDAMTQMRQEYTRLRNASAIKALPPGPATDRDIELALRGFPPENADATVIASFLRGMAKMQEIDAAVANAKTDWLANNNGVLTRATKGFTAGNIQAQPGESFIDFTQRTVDDVSKKYDPRTREAASPGAPSAPVRVTTPTGQVLTFPNQQAADAFKRAARIP
jgi:hypothetical protein